MTPDQRAALEILLDAQNVLDTDTQLMPLIRFVLFGTTGTVESEPEQEEPTAHAMIQSENDMFSARCDKCGMLLCSCYGDNPRKTGEVIKTVLHMKHCPNCHAKFVKL